MCAIIKRPQQAPTIAFGSHSIQEHSIGTAPKWPIAELVLLISFHLFLQLLVAHERVLLPLNTLEALAVVALVVAVVALVAVVVVVVGPTNHP